MHRTERSHCSRSPRAAFAALAFGIAWCAAAAADPPTFGWLEWTYLEPGSIRVKTKLDTGAKTSSVHAEEITPFERDGEPWVRFVIPLEDRPDDSDHDRDLEFERPVVREVLIKEFSDLKSRRYVVELSLCVAGITFTTPVTLADRSALNYPLLLGRRTLSGLAVVDPSRTFTFMRGCTARRKGE